MKLMTIAESAEYAGISKTTLYKYLDICNVPVIRVGGRTLIDECDLLAWLESQRQGFRERRRVE